MTAILSLGLGYLIGCFNPAALVSKKKNIDLKSEGTKNLGATNTALVLGRKAGYFVLFTDIFKSFFSYKLAKLFFPHLAAAGLIASFGVMLGHCFPVFMHFHGGKGLASFGGMVLAHDPMMFLVMLALGIAMAFLMNYGVYLAVTVGVLFPVMNYLWGKTMGEFLWCAIAGGFLIVMHRGNLHRAVTGEDPIHVRDGLKTIFGRK